MENNKNRIIHYRSNNTVDNKAKLPSADSLEYGELAINYADGVETIAFKNDAGEIVGIRSNEYIEGIIKDNEETTAASLTDLNRRLENIENSPEVIVPTKTSELINDSGFITIDDIPEEQFKGTVTGVKVNGGNEVQPDGSGVVNLTIQTGEQNVQSDWNETNTSSDAYIKNKPTSLKNPSSLTVGSKTYDGSSAVEIKATDLGLGSALKYLGKTSTSISDGSTTEQVTIGSSNITAAAGDVVIDSNDKKEYIWNGSQWEEFGNEGNYKTKQTAISSPTASSTASAFIDTISQDENGVISATKKNLPTGSTSTKGILQVGSNISVNSGTISLSKTNVTTALGYTPPEEDTTYENATTSTAGLMSSSDKSKLDGIATGATANTGTITKVQANGTDVASSGTANIPAASTSAYGVTKLSSATNSTSEVLAATPKAVKAAYDLANSYKGTITEIKMNGVSKGKSGVIDLGTVITEHQSISHLATKEEINEINTTITDNEFVTASAITNLDSRINSLVSDKQDTLVSGTNIKTINGNTILGSGNLTIQTGEQNVQSDWNETNTSSDAYIKNKPTLSTVAKTGSYNDLSNKPTIPSAVTESTVSGWGFTKNTGTITGVSANGTSVATSGVANIPAASTSAYGVTKLSSATNSNSEVLAATPKAVKAAYDLANSYKGTITEVKMNGGSKGTSGVVDLGNVGNITAVDTGDVLDDVNTEYATVAYVDGLVGDINSVLESIING